MPAINAKSNLSIQNNSGQVVDSASSAPAGDTEITAVLTGTGTNQEFDRSWVNSKVIYLWIKSNVNCTVYSNHASGSSPDSTVALVAGVPQIFPLGANPFVPADVGKLFITA